MGRKNPVCNNSGNDDVFADYFDSIENELLDYNSKCFFTPNNILSNAFLLAGSEIIKWVDE